MVRYLIFYVILDFLIKLSMKSLMQNFYFVENEVLSL